MLKSFVTISLLFLFISCKIIKPEKKKIEYILPKYWSSIFLNEMGKLKDDVKSVIIKKNGLNFDFYFLKSDLSDNYNNECKILSTLNTRFLIINNICIPIYFYSDFALTKCTTFIHSRFFNISCDFSRGDILYLEKEGVVIKSGNTPWTSYKNK